MTGKHNGPSHTTIPRFGSTIGWVDEPRSEGIVADAPIRIAGWALSIHAIRAVEVRFPGGTFVARYGAPRPDVAAVRPGYPAAAHCGFELRIEAGAVVAPANVLRSRLRVVVITGDGRETVIGERSLVDPAAHARWSFVSSRRCSSNAFDQSASMTRLANASRPPPFSAVGSANNMNATCGTFAAASPASQPHSHDAGALRATSPDRRTRFGSVIPPRNSCEN